MQEVKEGIQENPVPKKEEEESSSKPDFIKWFSELNKDSGKYAGGKGANLAEIYNLKVAVPPGFVVTAQAYDYFIKKAGLNKKISEILSKINYEDTAQLAESTKQIRELIENAKFPKEMQEEVLEAYDHLDVQEEDFRKSESVVDILKTSREPLFVAVRSSATAEDLESISKDEYVLVLVDNKPVYGKMQEIYEKYKNCKIKVPSMKNNKIVWADVKKIYRHKVKNVKLYKIETQRGRNIIVSPDHSLITLDQDTLKPKTIYINELKANDLVPTPMTLPEIKSEIKEINVLDYLNEKDVIMHKNKVNIANNSSNWKIQNSLPKKIKLTNDFAYFLGVYVAEGCSYKNNGVIITNSKEEIMQKIKRFLKHLSLYNSQKINKNSLRVYCKSLVRLLHKLTGEPLNQKGKGRSCKIKQVPNFIYQTNKDFIGNFLKGCFDGDGHVGKKEISITTASEILTGGIANLLELLGIEFYIRKNKTYYKILIPIHSAKKFKEKISFSHKDKLSKLNKLIKKYNQIKKHPKFNDNIFISEIFSNYIREKLEAKLTKSKIKIGLCPKCNKKIGKTSYYKNKLRYHCKNCKKTFYENETEKKHINSYVNYNSKGRFIKKSIPWNQQKLFKERFTKNEFKKIIKKYNLKEFKNLLNDSVYWDQIKKITPIKYSDNIYDFCVPKIENFSAGFGGIITHNTASFAGQQDSFVNIKGNDNLITHIKKCFASLYTSRATYYRNKKKFKHEDVSLAVIIQKMVDSVKSGVIFSKDPTHKKDNIVIEAVWGLGEGIVSGAITPDKYVVSQKLEIIDIKPANKKIAITRDAGGKKVTVKLREEKSNQQVLKEYEIKKLAEIAIKLEKHYQKPQDIEFAIEGEDIMIVQTRPITTIETRTEGSAELKGEAILSGLAASPGIGVGKVKIIENSADLSKITQGDVLVTGMTNPDMVVAMQKSTAIVTDEGGLTAHAAIVSREMGIPCIVGTQEATTKLKEGEVITVDGTNGKVYKGKVAEAKQKEVLPVTAQTKTEIKVIVDLPSFAERASKTGLKKVGLTRMEGIIAESGKHPQYFLEQKKIQDYEEVIFKGIQGIAKYFEEMWIRTSDIRSDEFQNLEGAPREKEANPMLGMHGIRYGLKNPDVLKAELKALKRVADEGKTIGLLLPQIISVDEVKKVKELLKEIDFPKAKVGIMVETPAAVQIINDLCKEGIDFISFGTNDLTQYLLAVDRGNEQVQYIYNELNPAILYQLEFVIRVCKRNKVQTSICGQAGSKKEMVKFLVEKGIDSISVNADIAKEIAEYVAELEKGKIKGTDQEPRQYELKKKEEQTQDSPNTVASPKEPQQYQPEKKMVQDKKNIDNKKLVDENDNELKSAENNINNKNKFEGETPKEDFVKPQKIQEDIKAIEEEKQEYEKNLKDGEVKENLEDEKVNDKKPVSENSKDDNVSEEVPTPKGGLGGEAQEKPPEIPGIQNLPKEKVEESIKTIEKEKQEYLKEHPEEEVPTPKGGLGGEAQEEFDKEPEFKDEKEINKKEDDEVLDIF